MTQEPDDKDLEDTDLQNTAAPLADSALDHVEGGVPKGVYVQEYPSGATSGGAKAGPAQRGKGVLQFDEADAVRAPITPGAVFEPNDEN